jgi:4-hydroxybenzoate polyprenyltransferase
MAQFIVYCIGHELLFHFCIYKPLFPQVGDSLDASFYIILFTYIFIAAAGYIINDYFDVNIDQVK